MLTCSSKHHCADVQSRRAAKHDCRPLAAKKSRGCVRCVAANTGEINVRFVYMKGFQTPKHCTAVYIFTTWESYHIAFLKNICGCDDCQAVCWVMWLLVMLNQIKLFVCFAVALCVCCSILSASVWHANLQIVVQDLKCFCQISCWCCRGSPRL